MGPDAHGAEGEASLYARLGVSPDADLEALRAAYRNLARRLHPDLHAGGSAESGLAMAEVNEAWAVLSHPDRRAAYDHDRRLRAERAARSGVRPEPVLRPERKEPPRFVVTRKEAWLAGMAMRMRFLAGYAGRSAAQAMLLRHPGTARDDWEGIVPHICTRLTVDVAERIRDARAAGAAPLDLANAACLIGLHAYGAELVGGAGDPDERVRHAEMVDRMYETLAYELPRELVQQLGNSPRVLRRLTGRSR